MTALINVLVIAVLVFLIVITYERLMPSDAQYKGIVGIILFRCPAHSIARHTHRVWPALRFRKDIMKNLLARFYLCLLLMLAPSVVGAQTFVQLRSMDYLGSSAVPTSTGLAGTTTGAGNNMVDVKGGVWSVDSNSRLSGTAEGSGSPYQRDFLLLPAIENPRDAEVILKLPVPTATSRQYMVVMRYQSSSLFYLFKLQYLTGSNAMQLSWYKYNAGLTQIGSTTSNTANGSPGTFTWTVECYGASSTNLAMTLADDTNGTLRARTVQTDSQAGLQVAGRMGLDVNATGGVACPINKVLTYYSNQTTGTGMTSTPLSVSTTAGAQVITFTGTGTGWVNGTTAMAITLSNCGCTIGATTVTTTTAATASITPSGTTSGSIVVCDGATPFDGSTNCSVVILNSPTITPSPDNIAISSTGNVITISGSQVNWSSEATFTLSGGTGASITAHSKTNATTESLTISAGSAAGQLTITDTTDNCSCTLLVMATYTPDNAAFYWCPWTWYISGSSYAQSQPGGAYMKVDCVGCTRITLGVDVSLQDAASFAANNYPVIRVSISSLTTTGSGDHQQNSAFADYQLIAGQTALTVATALASGTHTLYIRVNAQAAGVNRWGSAGPTPPDAPARITSLSCDGTLTLSSLSPKTMMVLWDSIGECKALGDDLGSTSSVDASVSTVIGLAKALNCEYGPLCYNGTGIVRSYDSVPGLWVDGTNSATDGRWSQYCYGRSFLSGGLMVPQPDYIVNFMGTNDSAQSGSTIQATTFGWLKSVRLAAPKAVIVWVYPIRQNWVSMATCMASLKAGIAQYRAYAPTDTRIFALDLNVVAGYDVGANMLDTAYGRSQDSFDGLHPNRLQDALLCAYEVIGMRAILSQLRGR